MDIDSITRLILTVRVGVQGIWMGTPKRETYLRVRIKSRQKEEWRGGGGDQTADYFKKKAFGLICSLV